MDSDNKDNEKINSTNTFKSSSELVKPIEKTQRPTRSSSCPKTPKIITWVIKYSGGYIKNESQAGYVILGFVAVMIIVSLFLIFGGRNKPDTFAPPAEIIPPA